MQTLHSYLAGTWVAPGTSRTRLVNPATEEPLAEIGTPACDLRAALDHARGEGGRALRDLTFAQRGELLRALSRLIHQHRDELIALAVANGGNTRGDAKFDIDGASATLAAYADLGRDLGDARLLVEGEGIQLARSARFHGQHFWSPRHGVAVHVNAFNFPAWGLAEKASAALLAGLPVVTKPASATALVACRLVELVLEAKALPAGALSLVAGGAGDLLDHLDPQDVLAFTGSSDTGTGLRRLERLARNGVRVNVEADSLNAAVLGPDAGRGTPSYAMFLADTVKEMTQKAGQKCTATRRILVPVEHLEAVREDLGERLGRVKVGNPSLDDVTMGPLSTRSQLESVRAGLERLAGESRPVHGGRGEVEPLGVEAGKGFFLGPVLLESTDPETATVVHEHEVFGPVATILAYDGSPEAACRQVRRGGGGLVASVYSDDRTFLRDVLLGIAPWHGRVLLASAKLEGQTTPPGMVLPALVHGGPGHAGGGEELGLVRGLLFYHQRTAVQGDRALLQQALAGAPLRLA